tara:strand:- start:252 stop:668 length:417 start_codon:yes stop_codon:yes gene_type:complete
VEQNAAEVELFYPREVALVSAEDSQINSFELLFFIFFNRLLEKLAGNGVQFKRFAFGIRDEENLSLKLEGSNDIPLNVSLEPGINFSSVIGHGDPRLPKNLFGADVRCPYRMAMAFIPNMTHSQGTRVSNLSQNGRNE